MLTQIAFAATLDRLADAGLEDFYRGDIGREMARICSAIEVRSRASILNAIPPGSPIPSR